MADERQMAGNADENHSPTGLYFVPTAFDLLVDGTGIIWQTERVDELFPSGTPARLRHRPSVEHHHAWFGCRQ